MRPEAVGSASQGRSIASHPGLQSCRPRDRGSLRGATSGARVPRRGRRVGRGLERGRQRRRTGARRRRRAGVRRPKLGSVARRADGTGCLAAAGQGRELRPRASGQRSHARPARPPPARRPPAARDGAALLPALAPPPAPAWVPQPLGIALTSSALRRPSPPESPAAAGTARARARNGAIGTEARLRPPQAPLPHPARAR